MSGGAARLCVDPSAPVLDIGGHKQLFIDERFMEAARGITLRMKPPAKLGVVLRPDRPWEDKSLGFCASVLEYEGQLRLYYESWSTRGNFVCLATSSDGVQWEKPSLGIVEIDGSRDNNVVYAGTDECVVFLDPHGAPEQRFKAIACQSWPDPERAGLYCHTSPDGLHWTPGPRVFDLLPDTANQAAWDAQRGKYVAYIRKWDPLRKVGRVETDDIMAPWPYAPLGEDAFFIWGRESVPVPSREIPTAFGYDDDDPVISDHYNPAVVEYPWAQAVYFSFPSAYLHFPEPPEGQYGNDGLLDIQMAVSRDGVQFQRPERAPYMRLGLAGEADSLSNYMAVGMLRVGDSLIQLHGAYDVTHGLPESEQSMPIGAFCALRQRLDGFVSADADMAGGELVTPPVTFQGSRLQLNVDTSAMGVCRVGLLDAAGSPLPGFGPEDCDEFQANSVRREVTWRGCGDVSALAGRPVRLRVQLRSARLYAFQFV
jgi:hypothetical protein